MDTKIKDQKFFKSTDDSIHVIDIMQLNQETWPLEIREGWIEITKEEAELISNPPATQQELDAQQKTENIAFLEFESERAEVAIKKLQRVIDRNIATDEEAKQFDELEIYSIKLMRVPNQETWPLVVEWPECPDFFKQ